MAQGTSPPVDTTLVVHSTGFVALPLSWLVDLDEGRLLDDEPRADLWLNGDYLVPRPGAHLALGHVGSPAPSPVWTGYGGPAIGRDGCLVALAAPVPDYGIPFAERTASLPSDTIPTSALEDVSHLCLRTGEGRVSEFWFAVPPSEGLPGVYVLRYTTWDASDREVGPTIGHADQGLQAWSDRLGIGPEVLASEDEGDIDREREGVGGREREGDKESEGPTAQELREAMERQRRLHKMLSDMVKNAATAHQQAAENVKG